MTDITDIGPRYLQVYQDYDTFSEDSNNYVKGEDHVCYIIVENEVIYWLALEIVWRPLNVVTTSAGTIEGIDNPVNVKLRTVEGAQKYTHVPNIPDAERIISMDYFLQDYPEIEYLDFTGNVNTTSMLGAFASSRIKNVDNICFDNVTNMQNCFAYCSNFQEDYHLIINDNASYVDLNSSISGTNLKTITFNLPNITDFDNSNFNVIGDSESKDISLDINTAIKYDENFDFITHLSKATCVNCLNADTNSNNIICPYFRCTQNSGIPLQLNCLYFQIPNKLNNLTQSYEVQVNIIKMFISNNDSGNVVPSIVDSFDIHYNQNNLKSIYFDNYSNTLSGKELVDSLVSAHGGNRIDLTKVNYECKYYDNSFIPKGCVLPKEVITQDDVENLNSKNIILPLYKDLELTGFSNVNISNIVENKGLHFVLNPTMFLKDINITDLGTHTLKGLSTFILDGNYLNSEDYQFSIDIDNNYQEDKLLTLYIPFNSVTYNFISNFKINIKSIINPCGNILLGSGIILNNSTIRINCLNSSNLQLVVNTLGQGEEELNTIFDDKYQYTIEILNDTGVQSQIFSLFRETGHIGQYSVDKFTNIKQTTIFFQSNKYNQFYWLKYKQGQTITFNSQSTASFYLESLYQFFDKKDTQNKPAIKIEKSDIFIYNTDYTVLVKNSKTRELLHYVETEIEDITNSDEYQNTIPNYTDLYIECIDEGFITFDVVYQTWKNTLYNITYATSYRSSNIENIYGENIVLSPKILKNNSANLNITHQVTKLTRVDTEALQASFDSNEYRQSNIKHIQISKALQGYWDIRIAPKLDEETLNLLVENLEAWKNPPIDETQDFNLYRNQWNLLTSEHQTMLTTKNYNIRITENTSPSTNIL